MDSFDSFEDFLASIEFTSTIPSSAAQSLASSPIDPPRDQERYGSGTTSAFCVIA
uniref:Pheromone receptor n=1 Tax=Cyclocybe aegerita TaxID=1973307 RepID=A0A3Q8ECQ8_CYCAE|nr:pheromone receptor [Cyclocybe aegerita]